MDNEKIQQLIEKNKKNSKLNKTELAQVALLLKSEIEKDDTSIDKVIDILIELHYAATAEFFKNSFDKFDNDIKRKIIVELLNNKKVVKNSGNFGLIRKLIVINTLLATDGNEESIQSILKVSAKQAYGKDGGQKAAELLCKICLENTKERLFLLDYSKWEDSELRSLSFWLDNAINKINDAKIHAAYNVFLDKYNLHKRIPAEPVNDGAQKKDKVISQPDQRPNSINDKAHNPSKNRIIGLVNELQSEINKLISEGIKLRREIEEIKSQLVKANKDKVELSLQLNEVHSKHAHLQKEMRVKEQVISDFENRITSMDERLRNSFNADRSQQNQEMIAFKNDLRNRLRLDYEDFKKLAVKEPNQQYYGALIGIIESIFDTLRRRGIALNREYEE